MIFIKKEKRSKSIEASGPGCTSGHISATAPVGGRAPTHISATASVARTGPIYSNRLQARPGTDSIRALRAALKVLWRRYQLRCLDAREVKDGADRIKP